MGRKKGSTDAPSVSLVPSDFVHLHNHTHHSLLDGLTKIPALVDKIKEYGMTATAVTDHGYVDPGRGWDVWRDLPPGSFSESGTNINTGILRVFAGQ